MHILVRAATVEDEARVVALWRSCGLVTSYNDPLADFRFACEGDCSEVLVGFSDGTDVKATIMVGHDGHRGWLYYVAVDLRSRNTGCGRVMVEAGENWLRSRNVPKVHLLVRESNQSNQNVHGFYEHLGYAVLPRTVMSKTLE